jgi:hypothetical protein
MFRCVVRYGYKDLHKKDDNFEKMLLDNLSVFIQNESLMEVSQIQRITAYVKSLNRHLL